MAMNPYIENASYKKKYLNDLIKASQSDCSSIQGLDIDKYNSLKENPNSEEFKVFNEELTPQLRMELFYKDLYNPFIRAMRLHRIWVVSGSSIDFDSINIKGGKKFDSEQMLEYIARFPDYIQHRLVDNNIVSPVNRRIAKEAIRLLTLTSFETVLEKEPTFGYYMNWAMGIDSEYAGEALAILGPEGFSFTDDYISQMPRTEIREKTPLDHTRDTFTKKLCMEQLKLNSNEPTFEEAQRSCILQLSVQLLQPDAVCSPEEREVFDKFIYNPFFPEIETGVKQKVNELLELFLDLCNENNVLEDVDRDEETNVKPQEEQHDAIDEKSREWTMGQSNESIHIPTDQEFSHSCIVADKNNYYCPSSNLGSSTSLKMSTINELYEFLVEQGKLANDITTLLLLAFRLTGRNPNNIDTNKKIAWIGTPNDCHLAFFLWTLFSTGKSAIASKYWSKSALFFEYAGGGVVNKDKERDKCNQFTSKTSRSLIDPFAKELRKKMDILTSSSINK